MTQIYHFRAAAVIAPKKCGESVNFFVRYSGLFFQFRMLQ